MKYQKEHNYPFPLHAHSVMSVLLKRQDMNTYKPFKYAAPTLQRTKEPWASKRFDSAASIGLQYIQFVCMKRSLTMGADPSGQNANISL